jgi:Bacterial Ig-like domain
MFIISFFIAPTSINGQAAQNNETLDKEVVINNTNAVNNLASNISTSNAASTNNIAANTTSRVIDSIFERDLPVYFLLVIAGAMVLPLVFDMFYAYRKKPKESIDKEDRAPVGMQGLYRTLMTFGVILLVGTVIFYVLALITLNINNPTNSASLQSLIDVLKNLSAILGTALATIIAFYFGMRGAESATAKAAAGAAKASTDTTAPTIVGTYPADGQKGISVNSDVVATFSKQMDSSTINSSTFTLKKNGDTSNIEEGDVTLTSDGKAAMLNPSSNLESSTKYTVTITKKVKDVAGNAMTSDKTWSFDTI